MSVRIQRQRTVLKKMLWKKANFKRSDVSSKRDSLVEVAKRIVLLFGNIYDLGFYRFRFCLFFNADNGPVSLRGSSPTVNWCNFLSGPDCCRTMDARCLSQPPGPPETEELRRLVSYCPSGAPGKSRWDARAFQVSRCLYLGS